MLHCTQQAFWGANDPGHIAPRIALHCTSKRQMLESVTDSRVKNVAKNGSLQPVDGVDAADLSAAELEVALVRRDIVAPLAAKSKCTRVEAEEAALLLGCSTRTIWTILKRYRTNRRLRDLLPTKGKGVKGHSFLDPRVDAIIASVFEKFHLSRMRPNIVQTVTEIRRRCAAEGLALPSRGSITRRLKRIPDIDIVAARDGRKKAGERFRPVIGSTPDTTAPLQRVQIDHTKVDLIVVDEINRLPLQRPFITIAIDEFSRAVLGFYLSLEAPSATSVGLCLVHSILPKDNWANRIGLEFPWPMYGRPDEIYVDNGSDFHSEAVERGCDAWGMKINFRPGGMAHFGGIIERMVGTAMASVKTLPGATGASIAERGDRNPDREAAMTLPELELIFATFFSGQYHRTLHAHHGITPYTKWMRGIFGDGQNSGRGIPTDIQDPQRLLIDFLPLERRKLTQRGIRWGGVHYMDDILRSYLMHGKHYTFIVRRDPRDVSSIWLLAPDDNRYYRIGARDISRPSLSLWELEAARRLVRKDGRADYDETALFAAVEAQRRITSSAASNKAEARRSRLAVERRTRNRTGSEDTKSVATEAPAPLAQAPWRYTEAETPDDDDTFEVYE